MKSRKRCPPTGRAGVKIKLNEEFIPCRKNGFGDPKETLCYVK